MSRSRGASNGVAFSRFAAASNSLSSTKRNSASGSTNRRMSHGHATRSTFTFRRVIHFIRPLSTSASSFAGVIDALDQFHASPQQFVIGQILPCPAIQDLVEAKSLHPAELLVAQVGIMDDLRDPPHPRIANGEFFAQSLEGTVLAAMPESLRMKHVKGNRLGMRAGIIAEDEARFGINEPTDEPG